MKRMCVLFAVLVTGLGFAGCDSQSSQAKEALLATLKDPGSVQWRNVRSLTRKDSFGKLHSVTCGEYNAKNGFGGYGGFQPFVFEDGQLHAGDGIAMWLSDCQES